MHDVGTLKPGLEDVYVCVQVCLPLVARNDGASMGRTRSNGICQSVNKI